MLPPDLTAVAVSGECKLDDIELCHFSFARDCTNGPIALHFLDDATSFSPQASAYKTMNTPVPAGLADSVSLWSREAPRDRVLLIRSIEPSQFDACREYLHSTPGLDCRIVAIFAKEQLPLMLPHAVKLAFSHLPVHGKENIKRSVDYSMALLNDLVSGKGSEKLPLRPVAVKHSALKTEGGGDCPALTLHSRGLPVRFPTPFTNGGFRINTKLTNDSADGAFISGSSHGTAVFGPYLPVVAGRYQAVVQIRSASEISSLLTLMRGRPSGTIAIDAYIGSVDNVLKVVSVDAAQLRDVPVQVLVEFEVPQLKETPQLELRVHQQSNRPFVLEFIELTWLE